MKVLIIGNGFDLTHGLKTTYRDFLNFAGDSSHYKTIFDDEGFCKEFNRLVQNNLWISYFARALSEGGNTWIDLENEVKSIVKVFEKATIAEIDTESDFRWHHVYKGRMLPDKFIKTFNRQFELLEQANIFQDDDGIHIQCERQFNLVEYLYTQLKRFVRSFEIYCMYVINKKTQRIEGKIEEAKIPFLADGNREVVYRAFPPELPIHRDFARNEAEAKKRKAIAAHLYKENCSNDNAQVYHASIDTCRELRSPPNAYLPCE